MGGETWWYFLFSMANFNLTEIHANCVLHRPLALPSRETEFSGTNADREIFIFPLQLTTCRTGNLNRLIRTTLVLLFELNGIEFEFSHKLVSKFQPVVTS